MAKLCHDPTANNSLSPLRYFFCTNCDTGKFLWRLLAQFRRSTIPNRQPVGQAACFNLSVHFRWELHLPNPGTRCQLADRSGSHDAAAVIEASPQRSPWTLAKTCCSTWERFPGNGTGRRPTGPALHGSLSEGRFNLSNLAMVQPNPLTV